MRSPKKTAKWCWNAWVNEKRTSIIGAVSVLCFITGSLLVSLEKMSMSDFVIYNGISNSTTLFVLSLFSADAKQGKKQMKEIKELRNEFFNQ